ncbi:MAG: methylenetetrahydrofolate reductase [Deltaproteobacteria bacterium]
MADLFQAGLESGSFQVVARVIPPRGVDFSSLMAQADSWKDKVDAILVADNASARMGASSLIVAEMLKRAGREVILTVSCRDRNRLDLGSTALGAAAVSLQSIFCVSGDFFTYGDHPESKPVYDLDSVQLIAMLRQMENGTDIAGNSVDSPPSFFLGAAVCPTADPLGPQLAKARKKIGAGADFLITLPIFSIEQLTPLFNDMGPLSVKIIAGVFLPSYEEIGRYRDGSIPGTFIPGELVNQWKDQGPEAFLSSSAGHVRELISELRSSGKVAGVCISASGREAEVADLL